MKAKLYHFWSDTASQRIRMALAYKQVNYEDKPLSYWDDETFFELGIARQVPVLVGVAEQSLTNSEEILWQIDELFPDTPPLIKGLVDEADWQALLQWRHSVDAVLSRLLAPALLSYRDISEDQGAVEQFKQSVKQKYGLSAEALANDRYASYEQFSTITRLPELARHLAQNRFYLSQISAADILITADLYPLQCLDGVSLPIDFLYYMQRVADTCNIDMQEGLTARI